MAHMTESTLQAYLDRELRGEERHEAAAHLASCAWCADTLAALEHLNDRVASAFRELDASAPEEPDTTAALEAVLQEAARRATHSVTAARTSAEGPETLASVSTGLDLRPHRTRREVWHGGTRSLLLRAAILILGFAGLAAAAAPGSPVRDWIATVWSASGARAVAESEPPTQVVSEPPAAAPAAPAPGVAVPLEDGRVRILFQGSGAQAWVRVRVVDDARAAVRFPFEAGAPRFATAPGLIRISGGGDVEFVVEIPRTALHASIEGDGRVLYARAGEDVHVFAPAVLGSNGEVVLPLNE